MTVASFSRGSIPALHIAATRTPNHVGLIVPFAGTLRAAEVRQTAGVLNLANEMLADAAGLRSSAAGTRLIGGRPPDLGAL